MKGFPQKKDFTASAKAAWLGKPPQWVAILAHAATSDGLTRAGKRIGYSASALSHVLANNYVGDLERVEKAVRGALMNETVMCPVVGEIPLNRCLTEQKRTDRSTSAARTRMYHACRGIGCTKCPHSLIEDGRRN